MNEGRQSLNDRFDDLVQVGSGSMGTVYKGWDREAGMYVAVKLLHTADTSARFEREARVLSQISHANIVRYVAHGVTPSGKPWLAMEWLEGRDLSTYLNKGTLSAHDTLRLARALAAGLSWAHDRGFVHRDLKPSNVFVPNEGLDHAKVVDFGLARDVVHEEALTKTGMILGTLEYMPPEQISEAKRADARADVYSLGALLFRCLTSFPPARGDSLPEIIMNIIRGTIPAVSAYRGDVPPAFVDLIASMLQKDADLRPASATHVLMALDAMDGRVRPYLDLDSQTELMQFRPSYLPESVRRYPTGSGRVLPDVGDDDTGTATRVYPPTRPVQGALEPPRFPPRPAPPVAVATVERRLPLLALALLALGVVAVAFALLR